MMELSVSQLWHSGPEWLTSDLPVHSVIKSLPMPEPCLQELKSTSKLSHSLLAAEKKPTIGHLLWCEDFSSLQKLLRVTAYVLRAVNRFKAKEEFNVRPRCIDPWGDCVFRATLDLPCAKGVTPTGRLQHT